MNKPGSKCKVFVVNDSGHDLANAKEFGDIVVISSNSISKTHIHEMNRLIMPYIDNSSPRDYILQSGPAVMNMVISAAFAAKHKRLNLLLWVSDMQGNERYICRRLSFRKERTRNERLGITS